MQLVTDPELDAAVAYSKLSNSLTFEEFYEFCRFAKPSGTYSKAYVDLQKWILNGKSYPDLNTALTLQNL